VKVTLLVWRRRICTCFCGDDYRARIHRRLIGCGSLAVCRSLLPHRGSQALPPSPNNQILTAGLSAASISAASFVGNWCLYEHLGPTERHHDCLASICTNRLRCRTRRTWWHLQSWHCSSDKQRRAEQYRRGRRLDGCICGKTALWPIQESLESDPVTRIIETDQSSRSQSHKSVKSTI
jgi:hypothetical protein